MWDLFISDCLFSILVIYLPGFLCLYSAWKRIGLAIVFAPLVSLFEVTFTVFLFRYSGISANCCSVLIALFAETVVCSLCAVKFIKNRFTVNFAVDPRCLLISVVVASLVGAVFYLKTLDSAVSFYQENDNIAHLTAVRDFINSGVYCPSSILGYPSLWRTVVAIVASFGCEQVSVAANAVNFISISALFPLSICALAESIFGDAFWKKIYSSVITCIFGVFPWGLLLFGPLYPNVLGFSLLPLAMTLFMILVNSRSVLESLPVAACFCFSCIVLFYAHPNSIFTGIAVLIPYCFHIICQRNTARSFKYKAFINSIVASAFIFIWVGLYKLPALQGVVQFEWPAYTSTVQAIFNVACLAFTKAGAPQFILSLCVAVGLFRALFDQKYRWLIFSFLFLLFIYIADVTCNGTLQHLLSGFWYTDSFRVSSSFIFVLIPLASIGIDFIFTHLFSLNKIIESPRERREIVVKRSVAVAALSACVLFPNFSIPQNISVVTSFGQIKNMLSRGNLLSENSNGLDIDEIRFANEAREIVGDASILNYPYDGSAYTYAICNLNVVNRGWYSNSSEFISYLSKHADHATGKKVRKYFKSAGIQYVMLLDYDRNKGGIYNAAGYNSDDWDGLENITDETLGYKLVLSKGDMRLYKVID